MQIAIILANCKGNLGDFAILDGMISYFQNKYDISKIDIYLDPVVKYTEKYCSDFVLNSTVEIRILDNTPKYINRSWLVPFQRIAKSANIWKYFIEPEIDKYAQEITNSDKLQHFEKYDLLAVAGGGLWGANSITKFGLLHGLQLKNKNIVCFPFTAAWPMWISNTSNTIRKAFSTLSHNPFVREELTHSRFHEIGIKAEKIPDIAFFLSPLVDLIDPKRTEHPNRLLISVTNRTSIPERHKRRMINTNLSLTKNEELISVVTNNLIKDKYRTEIITSCPLEDESWMKRLFAAEEEVNLLMPSNWQEFCSEIKSCSCLVTNRLHGAILGLLSNIPILLITDSDKTIGFSKSYSLIRTVKNLADVNSTLISQVLNEKNELVEKQKDLVAELYSSLKTLEFNSK